MVVKTRVERSKLCILSTYLWEWRSCEKKKARTIRAATFMEGAREPNNLPVSE